MELYEVFNKPKNVLTFVYKGGVMHVSDDTPLPVRNKTRFIIKPDDAKGRVNNDK